MKLKERNGHRLKLNQFKKVQNDSFQCLKIKIK